MTLALRLIQIARPLEEDWRSLEQPGSRLVAGGEVEQRWIDAQVVPKPR